jgi:hypothetical protein
MFYLVYKTTNLKNKKYYIGAHITENKDDNYLGSGKILKRAIKKYGKSNFNKIILYEASNQQEMYDKEKEEIDKCLNNFLCYNLKDGGIGGFEYINKNGLNKGDKNPMRSNIEAKQKCIDSVKHTRQKNPEKYKNIALNNLQKAIVKNKGRKRPEHSILISNIMKNFWKEDKEKMRDSLSSFFLVTSPEGNSFETNRLEEFCLDKNLPYTSIWKSSVSNKIIKKGKAKGWLCKKI